MNRPLGEMSSADNKVEWKEILMKGGLTGVVAGVAGSVLFGTDPVDIMGRSIPGAIPMAFGAAAGSVAADLTHKYVFPLIPHNEKYDKMEAISLSVGAAGLGTYAASSLFAKPALVPSLALGASSFVLSDWTYHNYLNQAGSILF